MGSNVVSLWQQLVTLLQAGTQDPDSCADASLFEEVLPLLMELTNHPFAPPKSTWKKLVQQLKVSTQPPQHQHRVRMPPAAIV